MGETVGLLGSDGLFFLCGFYFWGENSDAFEAVEGARGKALIVAKPAFPPRAPPFRARSCSRLWGCVELLTGRWMLRYREGEKCNIAAEKIGILNLGYMI